ncbi:ABC transporter permease [Bacillus sp. FJAT-22090]|uniref:ABC transporter permease n=1 Tax=Bacillus sp. FJAT-22090 TaxID=1581038 RepID=UPI0011A79BF2|nr:peptide ABC transporter permease [Bacillus sp. FJAT-22090]
MSIVKRAFKNKLFLLGFVTISGILLASLFYLLVFHDHIPVSPLLYDNSGKPLPAPYNWELYPPFGTDNFGRNIAIVMLVGAKYTIFAATVITIIRVVPSILFGFLIHFYLGKIERPIKYLADSINYFPITLFAILLLKRISYDEVLMSMGDLVQPLLEMTLIYIFVLSIVYIPTNAVLIANEVKLINKMEFIECSKTLGATTWHIITKHVKPFLVPQLYIIFIKEFMQSLILMSHLGVLSIFIGGLYLKEDLFGVRRDVSISSDWAGALGMWWNLLWTPYVWIPFIPIVLLTILILAAKCILDGLQHVLSTDERIVNVPEKESTEELKQLGPFQLLNTKTN